jgi:hypothetical protein
MPTGDWPDAHPFALRCRPANGEDRMKNWLLAGASLTFIAAGAAEGRVTELRLGAPEPFASGTQFGGAGAYERLTGTAKGELDPADPRNKGIVNLAKAPRNARGMVEYETEIFMLRPADPAKASGKLVYEVNNRGRKFLPHWLMDAAKATNDPKTAEDAGNGFFLRRGYTVVWSGWDPDAPRANDGMAMTVPTPEPPVVRTIRDELVNGTRGPLRDAFALTYPAASLEPGEARLTMRRKEAYPATEIPATGWKFENARTIRLLPEGTRPEPGALYELSYKAKNPKVLGIGFAATRDLVARLRQDGGAKAAFAVGISQSGRYLRDFIGQGFNQDESGKKVFDGVLAHISGIGRVFLNDEFGQPARTNTQHEDHLFPENRFPFSSARFTDPATGRSGALLRGDGFDPLLIEVNTSTEYWQKGASLLHTDPLGRHDATLPPTTRVYMVAGTQHAGRTGLKADKGHCANLRNPHNPSPALRALFVALDDWATRGVAPPESRVPRLADGTLVPPDRTGFPAIPGVAVAREVNEIARFEDWVEPQPKRNPQYRPLVAKVDADGNEVAGIRLPDIAVPLATYTGWNLYAAPFPGGELCDRDGTYIPFAKTKAERTASSDPRPSLEERYRDPADYQAKLASAAAELVRERLLLQEDADRYVAEAKRVTW